MDKLTPDDAFELGNQFRDAAILLGDWRIRNRSSLTKSEWDELDDRELRLLNTASSIYTTAVGLVLLETQAAVAHLQSSARAAKSAVQHIATLKQALDLASALTLFAAAVSSGNAAAIPAAIVAVNDAATAIRHPQGSESA
jgi:hypothetical protein